MNFTEGNKGNEGKRERGMLFRAEMVRALLAGRKTETRRLANPGNPDRIWVKENFWVDEADDHQPVCFYAATDKRSEVKLKPSIFMPRKLSRIDLEVRGVRQERLQEITEAGVKAEGFYRDEKGLWCAYEHFPQSSNPIYAWELYWDSHAKEGARWDDNPLVWVICFRMGTSVPGHSEGAIVNETERNP